MYCTNPGKVSTNRKTGAVVGITTLKWSRAISMYLKNLSVI
jgi:hypothetical protein